MQPKEQSFLPSGKLNVEFLIQENLRKYQKQLETSCSLDPHQFTYQLARKISEYIALLDAERPSIEQITKLIWSMQRTLIRYQPGKSYTNPYVCFDKVDTLIARTVMETTTKKPHLSFEQLKEEVRENFYALCDLPDVSSKEKMMCRIAALLAEKLTTTPSLVTLFSPEERKSLDHFIHHHITLYKSTNKDLDLPEFLRRTISLYNLAYKMPKNLSSEEIQAAIQSAYPYLRKEKPLLDQSIYAFISAEALLLKNKEYCYSIEYVGENLVDTYLKLRNLPEMPSIDLLEMLLWKAVSETEGLLQNLPYLIRQKIEEKIADILIDSPSLSFKSIIKQVFVYFTKMQELASYKEKREIDTKIHTACLQNDMLSRFVKSPESPLFHEVKQAYQELSPEENKIPSQVVVEQIAKKHLEKNPSLSSYLPQLCQHIEILYKQTWYDDKAGIDSALDRFRKWQEIEMKNAFPLADEKTLSESVNKIVLEKLPMLSF